MTIKRDKLYDEHRYLNAGEDDLEALIFNFANAGGHLTRTHVMHVVNMVKTCAMLDCSYTQCMKDIEENHAGLPIEIVNAIIMAHIGDKPTQKVEIASYSVEEPPFESWDEFYYNAAKQMARNSKCLSRRIGAVLVKDKVIIAQGYNGPPRGIMKCDVRTDLIEQGIELQEGVCPRRTMGFPSGQGIEVCIAAHAEANCINMCARRGIKAKGSVMYMTCGIPCKECMIKIIQAGIEEIVVTSLDLYDQPSGWLLENSEVKVRLFDFIKK
jgi:dCMP deaminase